MRNPVLLTRRHFALSAASLATAALSGCAGNNGGSGSSFGETPAAPAGPPQAGSEIGGGQYKVALILPLSAGGNAGTAAQSMKNAAEMALAEFSNPDIQFLIKDDAGNPQQARMVASQAMEEGARVILGPLFAQAVQATGATARPRNIPVIGFSTDASVAARGVYLLSFLPETDVVRVLAYAFTTGKRSYAAIVPENAYGSVVEATFREEVARRGGRVVALERYNKERLPASIGVIAQAARSADAVFIPDGGDVAPTIAQGLVSAGVNTKRVQLLGTGLWDDPRIFNDGSMLGGLYAAPDPAGFANFVQRYQSRYGSEPVRTATLVYDSTALVAALVRNQPGQPITDQTLTNPSGFSGIDGIFRFKPDGTNERGLAVMRVAAGGGQIVSPPPKSFGASGT
jgi:ABC-type branched-subunit amino acid transport system substrate-binding protein